jgi:SAM-dependent methyltransferase
MVRWRRVGLVLRVVRLSLGAPRGLPRRWDRFWAETRHTGDGGDVLWDSSGSGEARRLAELLARLADRDLPAVDLGCGNGRLARALAAYFPEVVGVDLAPHAVARARAESEGVPNAAFRVGDVTAEGTAERLADDLGASNVAVRGVLHVLPAAGRRRAAATIGALAGHRGTVLVAETNHRGSLLGYLESLGAGPSGVPGPLARALSAGLPRPSRFGAAELDTTFPPAAWERLHVDARAEITTVLASGPIPGFVAVLRQR